MISSTAARTLSRTAAPLQLQRTAAPAVVGSVRNLNVHEYISMELMQSHGIGTPAGFVATTPQEAEDAFVHKLNTRK